MPNNYTNSTKKSVYVAHDNIVSPLGFDSASNIAQISAGKSGIAQHERPDVLPHPFHSAILDSHALDTEFEKIGTTATYTRLEKMMILSLNHTIKAAGFDKSNSAKSLASPDTAVIISTTKGNVDALSTASPFPEQRAYLPELGKKIQDFFGFKNSPIIVSNACVSGILSVAIAKRLIQNGAYKNIFVVGGDMISGFILSGFNSFRAISSAPCRPFSKNRTGITIGEAAASVLVTSEQAYLGQQAVKILGDGSCNDANHISGPSRTGEGLYRSMQSAFQEAQVSPADIDYISAHGTATLFNDEMEAIAMNRMGLAEVPLNSLKGYYGHTLGASGLLEAIVGMHSMYQNTLYQSMGFDELGVSQSVRVIEETSLKVALNTFLKVASGFGGCNTAVIFKKI